MKIKRNNKQGISLIVLVITIIVMIVLAGAIIISVNNTGMLSSAEKAKLESEIAGEKEILNFCVINAKVQHEKRELTVDGLNKELEQYNAEAFMEVNSIVAKFNKSQRYYTIDANGKVENVSASGEKTLTLVFKKTDGSDGTTPPKEEYKIITDKYSIKLPVIEGYEPLEPIATGTITESTTVEIPYYVILDDDKELVFIGLDSAGKVTTAENDIVSYMVGDGSNTGGNGLIAKKIEGILKIPDTYKDKPIEKICTNSFYGCKGIVKLIIGSNVKSIGNLAFRECTLLQEVTYGKSVASIGDGIFMYCPNIKKIIIETEVPGVSFNKSGIAAGVKLEISEDNPAYKMEGNILYSWDGKTLYVVHPSYAEQTLIIPEEVETIYDRATWGNVKIQNVVLPESLKNIKEYAFQGCTGIQEVIIGKNVANIGTKAFYGSNSLKTVIIESSVVLKRLTSQTSAGYLVNYAETIYLKEGITEIGSYVVDNFDVVDTDKEGYVKYVKKVVE